MCIAMTSNTIFYKQEYVRELPMILVQTQVFHEPELYQAMINHLILSYLPFTPGLFLYDNFKLKLGSSACRGLHKVSFLHDTKKQAPFIIIAISQFVSLQQRP